MRFPHLARLDSLASETGYSPRGDSLSVFAENELQQIMGRTYDRKYPALDAMEHFPLIDGINPWAPLWAADSYDLAGEADWHAPGAKEINRADVSKSRNAFPVHKTALAYGYTLDELMAAQMAGIALQDRKAAACRRGIAQKTHSVILNGDAALKIPGALTNAAVPIMSAITGAWLTTATADQMLADLNAMVTAVFTLTKRLHNVNQILLPNAHFRRVSTVLLGTGQGDTVLSFFQKTNPGVNVRPLTELESAGPSGAARALAYEKSPENVGSVVPLMFQQMPPDLVQGGLEVIINCIERVGGAVWFYPVSGVFMDGI